jgi:serine/threonine protein phosphatase PrpC
LQTKHLRTALGWHSEQGRRPDNQDFVGACVGSVAEQARHGLVAAIADGVGGHAGGRVAAETAVRGFIDFYLGQSETVGVRRAAARAAEAVNAWVHGQGRTDPVRQGMATTLTAIVLRHRTLHVLHVGDSRLYRLRGDLLAQLTQDHVMDGADQRHVLRRAVGLEDALRADYLAEALVEGDRLVLATDGVHGPLRAFELARLLRQEATPERAARSIVAAALAAGGQDNATALVLDVLALPPADRGDLATEAESLPLLPTPRPGDVIDGYRLDLALSEGRYSALFLGADTRAATETRLVLKFPKPTVAADAVYRAAFVREGWVAAQVRSPWLGEAIEPAPGRRTRLYTVMPHYAGETLEARLKRGPPIRLDEGLRIGAGLAKGLAALHRAGIVHRDVKPENVMLAADPDGRLHARLIDFGVVRLPGIETPGGPSPDQGAPGTPSYMAPELMAGAPGDEASDVFALGVTLYRMFSGHYPYGEIEPFQRPVWRAPTPLQQRRPDLPGWLDLVLTRAVAVAPKDRQGDAMELALDLDGGAQRPQPPARRPPLLARNPVRFWQGCCLVLLFLLALSALWRR